MLGTSPPTTQSQISKKIPLLLVIMFHKEWDGREDGMGEKGGGSQASVTSGLLIPVISIILSVLQACLYPSYPHPRPTQACLYPLYSVSLRPTCTYHTHIQACSSLPVSIILGVPWTCSYTLYPYPGLLRPACIHCTWQHPGLLRPAHIHCTWCPSGLLVPVISTSRPA